MFLFLRVFHHPGTNPKKPIKSDLIITSNQTHPIWPLPIASGPHSMHSQFILLEYGYTLPLFENSGAISLGWVISSQISKWPSLVKDFDSSCQIDTHFSNFKGSSSLCQVFWFHASAPHKIWGLWHPPPRFTPLTFLAVFLQCPYTRAWSTIA